MKNEINALAYITRRRSVRRFTEQGIADEQIELLLKAAMAAPSAMNIQPWEFVVVRDQEGLERLRTATTFSRIKAPCAIVVCGQLNTLKRPVAERFWVQDCSAATENLLLMAANIGLGAVWCGVHPIRLHQNAVKKVLALPGGITPLNVIYIGVPAELPPPATKYKAEKVHREKYGQAWK
ncbi:MAG: nitroreductase family protein [Anaerolineaceae bacterium]